MGPLQDYSMVYCTAGLFIINTGQFSLGRAGASPTLVCSVEIFFHLSKVEQGSRTIYIFQIDWKRYIITLANNLPYSRKYWRSLNLVVWAPKRRFSHHLGLKFAICTCMQEKNCRILIWRFKGIPPNRQI